MNVWSYGSESLYVKEPLPSGHRTRWMEITGREEGRPPESPRVRSGSTRKTGVESSFEVLRTRHEIHAREIALKNYLIWIKDSLLY